MWLKMNDVGKIQWNLLGLFIAFETFLLLQVYLKVVSLCRFYFDILSYDTLKKRSLSRWSIEPLLRFYF